MAMILNKCLNNDVCDQINKLVVNDKINQLRDDIASGELYGQYKRDEIRGYESLVQKLEEKIEELGEEIEEIIHEDKFVDIESIIDHIPNFNTRSRIRFNNFMNNICCEKGIAFDIAETYDNFDDWYDDVLQLFLHFVVEDNFYNISLTQIFKAKSFFEYKQSDEFIMNNNKEKFSRRVVYLLLEEKFEENKIRSVKYVIANMKEWYNDKIKKEAKYENTDEK
tara:strand:- start:4424 stop:5092 length:669 start_codon:yes stop_codon:yes gene_type:complete